MSTSWVILAEQQKKENKVKNKIREAILYMPHSDDFDTLQLIEDSLDKFMEGKVWITFSAGNFLFKEE